MTTMQSVSARGDELPPPAPAELEMEVFRAGDYGAKGMYGGDELDALVAAYDPAAHEAPVTLDHAQTGAAHGWVKALRRRGDVLVATLHRLSPFVRAALAFGAFRKPSVELYGGGVDGGAAREAPRLGLRAVSLLGAAIPEVKGLAGPAFTEGAGGAAAADGMDRGDSVDEVDSVDGVDGAPRHDRTWVSIEFQEEPMSGGSFGSTQAAQLTSSTRSTESITSISSTSAPPVQAPRRACVLLDALRARGQYLPAWDRAGVPAFLEWLSEVPCTATTAPDVVAAPAVIAARSAATTPAALAFSEVAEARSPAEWFVEFLGSLGGVALGAFAETPPRDAVSLEGPRLPAADGRAPLSPRSVDLHAAAVRLLGAAPGLTYAEALRRASTGG